MITIREEQFRVLGSVVRERWLRELESLVRARQSSAAVLDDAALRARIGYALLRAEHHRLTWRASVTLFVLLAFAFGPGFERELPAQEALSAADPDAPFLARPGTPTQPDPAEARLLAGLTGTPAPGGVR